MMIIAISTKNGFHATAHSTRKDAVEYLISSLSGDYGGDFWASEDGENICHSSRCLDFTLSIHDGPAQAAWEWTKHADSDGIPFVLMAIAQAVLDGSRKGI